MKILRAEFWASARKPNQIPRARGPEIGLAGRSNVGKSSLLNRLTARKSLARTSRTPGCTRGLLFFEVAAGKFRPFSIVDFPGYGYASRSHGERDSWKELIEHYLTQRSELVGMLLLIDIRRGPQDEEMELANFLDAHEVPYAWLLTKTDKLARSKRASATAKFSKALAPAPVLGTSSKTGDGMDAVWDWLGRAADAYVDPFRG